MGQQSSNMGGQAILSPRHKVKKPPRPSAPPKIPKTPKHIVPENKVIPNGVEDMEKARKLLRPVSQELTKIHPDFADIFQYDPELDFLAGGDESSLERSIEMDQPNKVDYNNGVSNFVNNVPVEELSTNQRTPNSLNGFVPNLNTSLPNIISGASIPKDVPIPHGGLRRSQSMQQDGPLPIRFPSHKRQASLTNGSAVKQSVIIEDPREHLYNVTRTQPFSNLMPSGASLPLENSFGLDYSFNVTYAQLAEYRRQKKTSDLEEKTGRKLSDLGAEIKESSIVPKSPFDRQNLGAKTGPLSVSTGSSETGVSKSKKKRAPQPPGPPPGSQTSDSGFKSGSEPPADYDMEDLPDFDAHWRSSTASVNVKKEAPQVLPKRMSMPNITHLESGSAHRNPIPKDPILPPPSQGNEWTSVCTMVPPPPPPPPPPAPPLPSSDAKVISQTPTHNNAKSTHSSTKKIPSVLPGQTSLHESMNLARAHLEVLQRLENSLKSLKPKEDSAETSHPEKDVVTETEVETREPTTVDNGTENREDDKDILVQSNNITSGLEDKEEETSPTITNESSPKEELQKSSNASGVKKMNSLLQHDIILAAQARGAKVIKSKPPPVLEKPLDMSEMFRQELAKAASAREERRRKDDVESRSSASHSNSRPSTPRTTDDDSPKDEDTGLKETSSKDCSPCNTQSNPSNSNPLKESNAIIHPAVELKADPVEELLANGPDKKYQQPSINSEEDMSVSSSTSQRIFSSEWTPEDDLGSDDDIMADNYVQRNQSMQSEGFKSSMIPSKIRDLKEKKKEKKNHNKKTDGISSSNEKGKLESVRKLKESVQSGMKNAFGSISKASGKLLRKHKSQDFLDTRQSDYAVPSPRTPRHDLSIGSNWEIASSYDGSIRRYRKNNRSINGDDMSESSSDAANDVGDIDFSTGMNNASESAHRDPKKKEMKLAGVAYVSGKGELIVVSDKEESQNNGNSSKFSRKGQVGTSDTMSNGRQTAEDDLAREIREKERLLDIERQRQQEMENNFRRLRDLDTQERLQRLHTANMRQQITLLQQQQVQQAHAELNNNTISSAASLSNNTSMANSANMNRPTVDFAILPSFSHQAGTPNTGYTQQHFRQADPPSISHPGMGQNVQLPMISGTFNTSHAAQFTTHSAPMIGGTPVGPTLPNLSNQELNYLSEYMRMMGVPPPSTQQQWALLLSTVQLRSQPPADFRFHQNQNFSGAPLKSNGPDLSRLFASEKRLETTLVELPQSKVHSLVNEPYPISPYGSVYNTMSMDNSVNMSKHMPLPINSVPAGPYTKHSALLTGTPTERNEVQNYFESNRVSSQSVYQSEQKSNLGSANAPSVGNGLSGLSDYNITHNKTSNGPSTFKPPMDSHMSKQTQMAGVGSIQNGTESRTPTSPKFSSRVYGPIGFRPMSFSAGSST